MDNITKYVALDVSKDKIAIAVADEGRGPAPYLGEIPNQIDYIRNVLRKIGDFSQMEVCYEAGSHCNQVQRRGCTKSRLSFSPLYLGVLTATTLFAALCLIAPCFQSPLPRGSHCNPRWQGMVPRRPTAFSPLYLGVLTATAQGVSLNEIAWLSVPSTSGFSLQPPRACLLTRSPGFQSPLPRGSHCN